MRTPVNPCALRKSLRRGRVAALYRATQCSPTKYTQKKRKPPDGSGSGESTNKTEEKRKEGGGVPTWASTRRALTSRTNPHRNADNTATATATTSDELTFL